LNSRSKVKMPDTRYRIVHQLAHALAAELSQASMTTDQALAGHAVLYGLQSAGSFDQFIVKYRAGAPERTDPALRARGLDAVARSVAVRSRAPRSTGAQTGALRIAHQRRLAMGADVIRVDRSLDRVDSETLMLQLATDP